MSNVPHGRKMQWSSRAECDNLTGAVGGNVRKTSKNTSYVGASLERSSTFVPATVYSSLIARALAATTSGRVRTTITTAGGEQFHCGGGKLVGSIELNVLMTVGTIVFNCGESVCDFNWRSRVLSEITKWMKINNSFYMLQQVRLSCRCR
jgi:hypothetical protein